MLQVNSNPNCNNCREIRYSIQYDGFIQHNADSMNKFIQFCSARSVVPKFDLNIKELKLIGDLKSIKEAGKIFVSF